LKSITALRPKKREISREALNIYFSLSYIPAPYTIYKDVKKLPAGHYMRINAETLHSNIVRYWDISVSTTAHPVKTYTQAKQELRELLFDAVEKRMISDVPFGTFLSGGVDSGIVSAIAAKVSKLPVNTFSVGYKNKRYDESERARIVAKHIHSVHHEYILDYEEVLGHVDRIILNYDEPYADSSCIPTWFISKQASEKIKMVLSGDGGDEVFGGYNKYLSIRYRKMFNAYIPVFVRKWLTSESFSKQFLSKGDTRSFSAKLRKLLTAVDADTINSHLNIISLGFTKSELSQLLSEQPLSSNELLLDDIDKTVLSKLTDDLKLVRYLDKEISLEGDMLVKTDRACMLASIECRSPLLDYRLMEFSYTIPDEYLLQKSNKKRILKDTFADLLPEDFFNAPKSGFEIPIGEWFRTSLRANLQETLSVQNLHKHNLFNTDFVQKLITEHLSGKADYATKLWGLYCFQKWYVKNMM
jgi:asparagine synthase (glutamine-hydrolysing)